MNKLYLAGLIGYLTAREAANAAREAGNGYETLHHALRSLSDEEAWSRCELAKLWAMWELDVPGSRDMALEALTWFMGEGNETALLPSPLCKDMKTKGTGWKKSGGQRPHSAGVSTKSPINVPLFPL